MSKSIYEQLSEERKELQEVGKLPPWFSTSSWQILKEKYVTDEFPDFYSIAKRVSSSAAAHMGSERGRYERSFFNIIWNGWLALSTPVLANMGTDRGCPVSCSGNYVGDSIHDFYEAQKETAVLTKNGFGTSSYLGGIRPRGTPISAGGYASGVLPVLKDFVQLSRDVSQGNTRRGAWAGYLELEHPDFWEVANHILNHPDDCNIGWIVTNKFIERLNDGEEEAVKTYQRAMKVRLVTGRGYFVKIDTMNEQNPPMYAEYGLKVKASNLCVAPETQILTKLGYVPIAELVDEAVEIWNGEEWSEVVVRQTATNTKLLKVTTSAGQILECTPEHKWYVYQGQQVVEVRTTDLKRGDKLINFILPAEEGFEQIGSTITSVEDLGRYDDTYCFTEHKRHMGMFNGILTGQCTEITLHSDEFHTFTCVLSSLNLAKYDEWRDTDTIQIATIFLDCVAEEFIKIGRGIKGLERAVRFTASGRALGLGALGFHTYLQQNMLPLDSMEAYQLNQQIFKHLKREAVEASKYLAEIKGEPKWCKGFGLRNTHLLAIAPNSSSALVCGGVSQGIEPVYQNVYVQGSPAGEINRINPVLLDRMKIRGIYSEDLINTIIKHKGSIQNLEEFTEEEKAVFKTAFEWNQEVLVRLASARQRHICQAQSLNLFYPSEASEQEISRVHQIALTDKWLKSLYYLRTESGVQGSTGECTVCEG